MQRPYWKSKEIDYKKGNRKFVSDKTKGRCTKPLRKRILKAKKKENFLKELRSDDYWKTKLNENNYNEIRVGKAILRNTHEYNKNLEITDNEIYYQFLKEKERKLKEFLNFKSKVNLAKIEVKQMIKETSGAFGDKNFDTTKEFLRTNDRDYVKSNESSSKSNRSFIKTKESSIKSSEGNLEKTSESSGKGIRDLEDSTSLPESR